MIISIIIATYNAEKTLKRCLDSIVYQKGDDIEVVVVDGKSSDSTAQIVKSYGNYINTFISERDKGIYDAWNKGVSLSKGEWVMFVGADDYMVDGILEKYLQYLQHIDKKNVDLICGKCLYRDSKGNVIKTIDSPYDYNSFRRYFTISHGSSLHNRSLFNELGKFDLSFKVCADYEFLLRRKLKAAFFDEYVLSMEVGGMSFSTKALIETYNIRKKHHSIPFLLNIFYFYKAMIGLYIKKIFRGYR